MNIVFQILNWREYCERFTGIVALKIVLIAISYHERERKGSMDRARGTFSPSRLFCLRETPFLI